MGGASEGVRRPYRVRRCREAIEHWEAMEVYCKQDGLLGAERFRQLLVDYRAELAELEADTL